MNLRQAAWGLAVVGALLVGFIGGQVLTSEKGTIEALQKRVADLEARLSEVGSSSAAASKPWRIAVVKVNDLALRYQESNPELKAKLRQTLTQLQEELQRLKQQQERGELTKEEATTKALELQQAVQKEILLAVAGPIQWAVTQVAQEEGYDVVMRHEDVILYYQGGVIEDITERVWEKMQASQ